MHDAMTLNTPQKSRLSDDREWIEALERKVCEASDSGGGDVIVRTRATTGTLHVRGGAIAWVVAGDGGERLSAVLLRYADVSLAALRATYKECRAEGTNFAEALIARGVVDRATARAALLEHNAAQLARLLESPPTSLEVVPRDTSYASELVFAVNELVEEMRELRTHERLTTRNQRKRTYDMGNIKQSLDEIAKLEGAIAAALVDWESGLTLGTVGGGSFDIELAASGNTSVVRAKMAVMQQLNIAGPIEDILITLGTQYHLIRPLASAPSLFLYVAIDKTRGNLGLARHKLRQIEEQLVL